jgi:hypothetical protein
MLKVSALFPKADATGTEPLSMLNVESREVSSTWYRCIAAEDFNQHARVAFGEDTSTPGVNVSTTATSPSFRLTVT